MSPLLKYTFPVLILLLLIPGCSKKPPEGLIRQNELVPILVDMHMVYAVQSTMDYRNLARKYDSVDVYSYIFEKHGITKVQFDSTIAWFSRNPELFTEVYDEVIMQLTQTSDSIRPPYE